MITSHNLFVRIEDPILRAEKVTVSDVDRKEFSPCGIMSNFADFNSENFDTVNGAMVRGHAEQFAHDH